MPAFTGLSGNAAKAGARGMQAADAKDALAWLLSQNQGQPQGLELQQSNEPSVQMIETPQQPQLTGQPNRLGPPSQNNLAQILAQFMPAGY